MGCWSPVNAMEAYAHTLHLRKDNKSEMIEPECMEFISALAAGNQAQLMVEITSNGVSCSTLALAIAARYTGGRLICICPNQQAFKQAKAYMQESELSDVVGFRVGKPSELIKQFKNIDFAVVDQRIEDFEQVLFDLEMNPNGAVVVVSNLFHGRRATASSAHARSSRSKVESAKVLPFGNGIEVTKFAGKVNNIKRSKRRTFLVYEE